MAKMAGNPAFSGFSAGNLRTKVTLAILPERNRPGRRAARDERRLPGRPMGAGQSETGRIAGRKGRWRNRGTGMAEPDRVCGVATGGAAGGNRGENPAGCGWGRGSATSKHALRHRPVDSPHVQVGLGHAGGSGAKRRVANSSCAQNWRKRSRRSWGFAEREVAFPSATWERKAKRGVAHGRTFSLVGVAGRARLPRINRARPRGELRRAGGFLHRRAGGSSRGGRFGRRRLSSRCCVARSGRCRARG